MFRKRQLPRQASLPRQPRLPLLTSSWKANCRAQSRAGRAFTEVVLIILVPCVCLTVWALCDADLKRSLMAGPNKEQLVSVNPVYDTVNMENDTILTVQGQGQLRFWNLNTSGLMGEMQSHLSEVRCAAYSSKHRLLAVGSAMGRLEVWDLEHPEMPIKSEGPPVHEISDCVFTADGETLISSGEDGKLLLWNPNTLERIDTLESAEEQQAVRSLAVSPDGKLVLAGTHTGLVLVWDLQQRKLIHSHRVASQIQRPVAAVESVSILGNSGVFVAATRCDGVSSWNLETGERVHQFAGDVSGLRSGTISGDGKVFVAGTETGLVIAWDTATGKEIGRPAASNGIVRALACGANGTTVLRGEWNGQVRCHPTTTPTALTGVALR